MKIRWRDDTIIEFADNRKTYLDRLRMIVRQKATHVIADQVIITGNDVEENPVFRYHNVDLLTNIINKAKMRNTENQHNYQVNQTAIDFNNLSITERIKFKKLAASDPGNKVFRDILQQKLAHSYAVYDIKRSVDQRREWFMEQQQNEGISSNNADDNTFNE